MFWRPLGAPSALPTNPVLAPVTAAVRRLQPMRFSQATNPPMLSITFQPSAVFWSTHVVPAPQVPPQAMPPLTWLERARSASVMALWRGARPRRICIVDTRRRVECFACLRSGVAPGLSGSSRGSVTVQARQRRGFRCDTTPDRPRRAFDRAGQNDGRSFTRETRWPRSPLVQGIEAIAWSRRPHITRRPRGLLRVEVVSR
jgi:hypothetical protein